MSVLMDNWTLQCASEAITEGLGGETTRCFSFDARSNDHILRAIPRAVVQLESLSALVTAIILQDSIVVDKQFVEAWHQTSPQLDWLATAGVIEPKDVLNRNRSVERASVTREFLELVADSATLRHCENNRKLYYLPEGDVEETFYAQIVLGGVSYLEASSVTSMHYIPHPSRRRLLTTTKVVTDAPAFVLDWAAKERQKIIGPVVNERARSLAIAFPPLLAQVMLDSNDPTDVLRIAEQRRREYKDVRSWLAEFQHAIDTQDAKSIASFRKVLEEGSAILEAKAKPSQFGLTDVRFGVWGLGSTLRVPSFTRLRHRFGFRAQLQKLVLGQGGQEMVKKCVRLLGNNSEVSWRSIQSGLATD